MANLKFIIPGLITFGYFTYLSVSLFRSNWKRRRTLQEQQEVRERVVARLEQERQEEEQQQRDALERKREIDKTVRMEQIMNALQFEILPDEENQTDATCDNSSDADDEVEAGERPDEGDEGATGVGNSLAAKILSSERKGNKQECVICLQSYESGQVLCSANTNQCHHIFHEECAIGWLQESNECPLCRVNLLETAELSV